MKILLVIFLLPLSAFALDFGKVGTTYPIMEKDLLVAIEEKASAVDWNSVFTSEAERLKRTLGLVSFELAAAKEAATRFIDLTATLEHDIQVRDPNGKLRTIYPKGFKYNVLEHIEFPDVFVILNANRQSELNWYANEWLGKSNVYPIVSQGDVLAVTGRYKYPFTKINQIFIDKFKIEATPTVMRQDGSLLRLDEILIKEGDANEE